MLLHSSHIALLLGTQAGATDTTGGVEYNVFMGYQAGFDPDGNATTSNYNVGIGALALEDLTNGSGNVGIGRNAFQLTLLQDSRLKVRLLGI